MIGNWRQPIIGAEAEARGAAQPENVGWKIAYGLRDARYVRIRAANAGESINPLDELMK